jgi:adenylate kinase
MAVEPLYVVLLGAPGAGKGTQAGLLAGRLGVPHVSSGDLFRENLTGNTALGQSAKEYIDKGELVPDAITIAMVMERLAQPDCEKGALLDGFPRTLAQAQALETALAGERRRISAAPYIRVSEEILLARLAGRWTCQQCQAVYHQLFSPPRVPGVCDVCGGALYQRADDTPETHAKRIEVYMLQTRPLIDYYRAQGLLREIDGEQSVAKVQATLLDVVQGLGKDGHPQETM